MDIYSGGAGEHGRIEVSEFALRTLEKIRERDSDAYATILATVQYFFEAWIPGDTPPADIEIFGKLSKATSHQVYRIKAKRFIDEWRLIVIFVPYPPRNPMLAELFWWESNKDSYDNMDAPHNLNVRKLVQQLTLAGRMKRR